MNVLGGTGALSCVQRANASNAPICPVRGSTIGW
jgi:hypothetical protein